MSSKSNAGFLRFQFPDKVALPHLYSGYAFALVFPDRENTSLPQKDSHKQLVWTQEKTKDEERLND